MQQFYLGIDNKNQVIRCLKKIVNLDPFDASAWRDLGKSYCLNGDINKDLSCLDKSHQLTPNDSDSIFSLSVLHELKRNKEETLEYLRKYIKINPNEIDHKDTLIRKRINALERSESRVFGLANYVDKNVLKDMLQPVFNPTSQDDT